MSPRVQIQSAAGRAMDLTGTVAHMGDYAGLRATGGVAIQDDFDWYDGAAGPRSYNLGAWDQFPTPAGGVQMIDDSGIGLGYLRVNNPAAAGGIRSRKQFQLPTKTSATVNLSCAMPWRTVYLEMLIRLKGTLYNITPDNYFFGWHSNAVAIDFAGGRCIAFVVTNGLPAVISAVIRDVGETRFTLPNPPDDDWHVYSIVAYCQTSPTIDAPGPDFFIDGTLVQSIPSGHADLTRGPLFVKMGHFNETDASLAVAWVEAGYTRRRKGLRP